jgi:hypothetical protein
VGKRTVAAEGIWIASPSATPQGRNDEIHFVRRVSSSISQPKNNIAEETAMVKRIPALLLAMGRLKGFLRGFWVRLVMANNFSNKVRGRFDYGPSL